MRIEIERFLVYLKKEYKQEDLGYNKYLQLEQINVDNLDVSQFETMSVKNMVYLLLETLITFGRSEKDASQQDLAIILEKEMIKLLANQYLKSIQSADLFQEISFAKEIMSSFEIAEDNLRIKCIPFLCHATYMMQYYTKIKGHDIFEVIGENYEEKYLLKNSDFVNQIQIFLSKYYSLEITNSLMLSIRLEGTYRYAKETILTSLKYYISDTKRQKEAEDEFLKLLNQENGTTNSNTNSKTSLVLTKGNGFLQSIIILVSCICLGILLACLVV